MELQIIIFIILFLLFNGMLFLRFDTEEQVVVNKLCNVIESPHRAKEIMFPWNDIPKNEYDIQQWANHKLGQHKWIFWNAMLYLIYDTKFYIILINSIIVLASFIIPKYM